MKAEYLAEFREIFTAAYVSTALEDVADSCSVRVEDCGEDCNGSHDGPTVITREDVQPMTLARLELDAREFFNEHAGDLAMWPGDHRDDSDAWPARTGAQFWMSRSGSGSGFIDWYENGAHPQDPAMIGARDRLSAAASAEGERDLFRDTDNKISHGVSWGELQRSRTITTTTDNEEN